VAGRPHHSPLTAGAIEIAVDVTGKIATHA
jgi:hypothetical protein